MATMITRDWIEEAFASVLVQPHSEGVAVRLFLNSKQNKRVTIYAAQTWHSFSIPLGDGLALLWAKLFRRFD